VERGNGERKIWRHDRREAMWFDRERGVIITSQMFAAVPVKNADILELNTARSHDSH